MRTLTRAFVVAPLVGVAALAVGVVPASASTTIGSAPATSSGAASTTTLPVVTIKVTRTYSAGGYVPHAITVAPKTFTTCTRALAVLAVVNKTTATQTMTYSGTTFATIAPSSRIYICADPAAGTYYFKLTSSKSRLALTIS